MGIVNKKWFALGLIGTFIAVGGVIDIVTSALMLRMTERIISSSLISSYFMYNFYYEMYGGMEGLFLIQLLSSISRYNRMLTIFRFILYIGIGICSIGGILAIIGWTKFITLEKS